MFFQLRCCIKKKHEQLFQICQRFYVLYETLGTFNVASVFTILPDRLKSRPCEVTSCNNIFLVLLFRLIVVRATKKFYSG